MAWYHAILNQQGLRPVTVRMYADDFLRYLEFCMEVQADHWSKSTVERYFQHLVAGDGISLQSARRLVSGLRKGFLQRGTDPFEGPRWQGFFRGIKLRAQVPAERAPCIMPVTRRMLVEWAHDVGSPPSIVAARNKALILLGWTTALSGSELQLLCVDHILAVSEGMVVKYTGHHARTVLVYPAKRWFCDPIAAVRAWRTIGGIDHGYVFRSVAQDGQVTDRPMSLPGIKHVVRDVFGSANLNANSLQSGWVAAALGDGCPLVKVHTYTRIPTERLLREFSPYLRHADCAGQADPGLGWLKT